MDTNTIMLMGNFIAIVAMFITMVVLIQSQNKKFDALNERMTKLEISTNERFTSLEKNMNERFVRIEMRLDRIEENKNSMILV